MITCDVTDLKIEPHVSTVVLHITVPKSQVKGIEKIGSPLSLKLGRKQKKRSLSANAYLWVLCSKLGKKLKIPKEEVYRNEVRAAGQWTIFSEVAGASLEEIASVWESKGIGYQTELMDGLTPDGRRQMIFYLGSSAYTTDQMAHLLDVVIADAEQQGIDTITPSERAMMLEEFDNAKR